VRHVRMLGLCLVAALALGAYAVSSASALEWGKCEFVGPGGNYNESSPGSGTSNCSKSEKAKPKGTGEYEWRKATEVAENRVVEGKTANVPFSGESVGGGGVLATSDRECNLTPRTLVLLTREKCAEETEGEEFHEVDFSSGTTGVYVECSKENNTGETEGKNKVANVHVVFTGCLALGQIPCESAGRAPGEIETNELKGKLGWINKANKEVGVVLEPAQHHGTFAEFECSGYLEIFVGVGNKKQGANYVIGEKYPEGCEDTKCPGATPTEEKHGGYDQVISPITPVNQMTNEFEQVYAPKPPTNELDRNNPDHLEGKHLSALEDNLVSTEPGRELRTMWSASSEEVTNVNEPEEEGEIKA
jgi:hypothetical protein